MRISFTTLNLWNTAELERRRNALTAFLSTYRSDIYCFQEIRPELIHLISEALPDYEYVHKDKGWMNESNIFFKKSIFSLKEVYFSPLEMPAKERGLFTVRLKDREGNEILVSTVHFTYQEYEEECRTGLSSRHREAVNASKQLLELPDLPHILAGDFNDPVHPQRIIAEMTDFKDIFRILSTEHPLTFPNTFLSPELYLVEAIDRIMVRKMRPALASSPRFVYPGEAVSDHYPVCAMFEYCE